MSDRSANIRQEIGKWPHWKILAIPIIYLSPRITNRRNIRRMFRILFLQIMVLLAAVGIVTAATTLLASGLLAVLISGLGFDAFLEALEDAGISLVLGAPFGIWLGLEFGTDSCDRCFRSWLTKVAALALEDESFWDELRKIA